MQETILDTGFATFPPRRVYLSSIQEIQMVLQTGYGNHLLLFHAVIYLMLGWCGETTWLNNALLHVIQVMQSLAEAQWCYRNYSILRQAFREKHCWFFGIKPLASWKNGLDLPEDFIIYEGPCAAEMWNKPHTGFLCWVKSNVSQDTMETVSEYYKIYEWKH